MFAQITIRRKIMDAAALLFQVIVIVGVVIAMITGLIKIGMWVGAVNVDRKSFNSFMEEIRKDIKKIFHLLSTPGTSHDSPLRLNQFGRSLVRKMNMDDWIEAHLDALIHETENKNSYQIQERCFEYAENEFLKHATPDLISKLHDIAFDNGLNMTQLMRIVGIVFRDRVLESRGLTAP